jgi:hypothetical protein
MLREIGKTPYKTLQEERDEELALGEMRPISSYGYSMILLLTTLDKGQMARKDLV